ncbi:MAG: hypothetical protein LLG14_18545 [Nocardiaceae bacterium]|nr:hypothetical protein [Nocardiaceae bacterium]
MTTGVNEQRHLGGAADTTVRWIVLAVCWSVAAQKSGERLIAESRQGSMITYIYAASVLAAIALIGIARRPWKSLPIYDRQADVIVGGMGIGLAIGVQALLLPRYPDHYSMIHLDAWSLGVFVLSGAVLMFGLRPLARFWQVWLFVFVFAPFPYRILVLAVGGQSVNAGYVMVAMASIATAIAVGSSRGDALAAAAATAVIGTGLLNLITLLMSDPPRALMQSIPAVVAAVLVSAVVLRPHGRLRFADPLPSPTARGVRGPMITLVGAAIAMHLVPLPPPVAQPTGPAPASIAVGRPLKTPAGWIETATETFPWVSRYLGSDSTLRRQRFVAVEPVHAWDVQDRPRIVVVDSLSTTDRAALSSYPEGSLYEMSRTRKSPALTVALGNGISARLYTVVDEQLLLTWTKLTFQWANSHVVQRVSIFSVDDHRATAAFPEPQASRGAFFANIFTVLLRGNAVTADANPNYQDRALLETVGRALVAAQQAP